MARPQKEGMDYFPHDVNASTDTKIEALRSLYGNDGYVFYFIMLEKIYSEADFQLDVSDAETREEMFQILAEKVKVTPEKFSEMLQTAFRWGAFDRETFERDQVITSKGIQKRASVVLEKRRRMRERYRDDRAEVSASETPAETRGESGVSAHKEKKRKEKESKEKKSNVHAPACRRILDHWVEKAGEISKPRYTKKTEDLITTKLKLWSEEKIKKAIDNYAEIFFSNDYYYTHHWTLPLFVQWGNGAPRFLPGLDEKYDGDLWKDYLDECKPDPEKEAREARIAAERDKHIEDYLESIMGSGEGS